MNLIQQTWFLKHGGSIRAIVDLGFNQNTATIVENNVKKKNTFAMVLGVLQFIPSLIRATFLDLKLGEAQEIPLLLKMPTAHSISL